MSLFDTVSRKVNAALTGGVGKRCDEIGKQLGLRSANRGAEGGGFAVPFNGNTYPVVAEEMPGGHVRLTAHSRIEFPKFALPGEVAECLARRNRERLPKADWENFHGEHASNYVLVTRVRAGHFDAGTVQEALQMLIPEVAALDVTLEQMGYAD